MSAKDRQAAEANKNATILLEELDKERQWEESKRAAAAKRRERKKKKKKEKMEKEKESNAWVHLKKEKKQNMGASLL